MRDGKRNFSGELYWASFTGEPRRYIAHLKHMIRALTVLFAIFVLGLGLCSAEKSRQPGDVRDNGRYESNTLQPNPYAGPATVSSPGEDSAAENELWEAVNKSRRLAGAPPLRLEESLREAARAHARHMVENDKLEHRLPGEASLLERIAVVSPLKMDRVGENIANAACALGANDVLMGSAPHRENLLDRRFNVAGIAAIWSKGRLYVVQDFAREVPSYSNAQSEKLVGSAIEEVRQQAGLPELVQLTPSNLDEAACSLARENRPNARLLATAYDNRKIATYSESHPEVLPQGTLHLLRDPGVRQFAVGACYARNAAYPTGTYWVAILLY